MYKFKILSDDIYTHAGFCKKCSNPSKGNGGCSACFPEDIWNAISAPRVAEVTPICATCFDGGDLICLNTNGDGCGSRCFYVANWSINKEPCPQIRCRLCHRSEYNCVICGGTEVTLADVETMANMAGARDWSNTKRSGSLACLDCDFPKSSHRGCESCYLPSVTRVHLAQANKIGDSDKMDWSILKAPGKSVCLTCDNIDTSKVGCSDCYIDVVGRDREEQMEMNKSMGFQCDACGSIALQCDGCEGLRPKFDGCGLRTNMKDIKPLCCIGKTVSCLACGGRAFGVAFVQYSVPGTTRLLFKCRIGFGDGDDRPRVFMELPATPNPDKMICDDYTNSFYSPDMNMDWVLDPANIWHLNDRERFFKNVVIPAMLSAVDMSLVEAEDTARDIANDRPQDMPPGDNLVTDYVYRTAMLRLEIDMSINDETLQIESMVVGCSPHVLYIQESRDPESTISIYMNTLLRSTRHTIRSTTTDLMKTPMYTDHV